MSEEMKSKFVKVLMDAYAPRIRHQLRDHPDFPQIADDVINGKLNYIEVEIAFHVAASESWKKILDAAKKMPEEDGTIKYAIYNKDLDQDLKDQARAAYNIHNKEAGE